MSQISLSIGEQIEDYEILDELGKGGFAIVYRARCRKSNFEVAIKMINKASIQTDEMRKRIRQEITIHSKLKHPSILELYAFFEDANNVYLVLELAHNGELYGYMKKQQRMTEVETAIILNQVVNGLLYLKSQNILHRDMSLSNLLLTKEHQVKIADFGLATQLRTPDETHRTMCGTPNYISPEVASRASHGFPADVWGLGCMMFTLLTGAPPFDTDSVRSTLTQVVMSDVTIPAFLSNEARDLLSRMLCKNPTHRIHIDNVLSHPFMSKSYKYNNTMASVDSGLVTMSSGTISTHNITGKFSGNHSRSRSEDRQQYQSPSFGVDQSLRKTNSSNFSLFEQQQQQQQQQQRAVPGYGTGSSGHKPYESMDLASSPSSGSGGLVGIDNGNAHFYGQKENENQMNKHHFTPILSEPLKGESQQQKIGVEPFSSERLLPTRHKTGSAILSILPQGEVVIEFIKKKLRYGEERVIDVCRISKDGLRIAIYQPDAGRGLKIQDIPPELPESGADAIYSYENLPSKHWKKYIYASRFVQLVKAKTPKITYYSIHAKCQLMETLSDFEMHFYDGTKVIKTSTDKVTLFENNGREVNLLQPMRNESATVAIIAEQFEQCLRHCQMLEAALTNLQATEDCFPVIIGRRPGSVSALNDVSRPNILTPRTPNMPSFQLSISSLSSRSPSVQSKHSANIHKQNERCVEVPGIGVATQLPDGVVEVAYPDGSRLSVIQPEHGGGVTFKPVHGHLMRYKATDELPELVRTRLKQMPAVIEQLMAHNSNILTSPVFNKLGNNQYQTPPIMRFFR